MIDSSTIFQCEDCLRYFRLPVVGDGSSEMEVRFVLISPQPVLPGLPEVCVCGWGDCAGIKAGLARELAECSLAAARPADERRRLAKARLVERRLNGVHKGARRGAGEGKRVVKALGGAAAALGAGGAGEEAFSCCPPEREGVLVGSGQREFLAAVDVSGAVGLLLNYFRGHYGEWIPMVVLKGVADIEVPHSRMPEVRALLEAHLDIDQESKLYEPTGKAHSHYRLCLKSESHRLKRQEAAVQGQPELTTRS